MPDERSMQSTAAQSAPASDALHRVTAANRESWNRIAPKRDGEEAAFFRGGVSTLEECERELAGDVAGKRVLHLACSNGDEVLSWANLGATAMGADISDVAVEKARAKAADAGIHAEFHRADMFDLPAALTELDLVYLSWGAICWAPDLDVLAAVFVQRLRLGGSVLLADHHPLWEILTVEGENRLTVSGDYFGRAKPRSSSDATKQPVGARDAADASAAASFAAFVWPVSDVVMALVHAGMRLDAFWEAAEPAIYADLGPAGARLPAIYVIKATRV